MGKFKVIFSKSKLCNNPSVLCRRIFQNMFLVHTQMLGKKRKTILQYPLVHWFRAFFWAIPPPFLPPGYACVLTASLLMVKSDSSHFQTYPSSIVLRLYLPSYPFYIPYTSSLLLALHPCSQSLPYV